LLAVIVIITNFVAQADKRKKREENEKILNKNIKK
jgi:hypothetical protein